MDRTSQTDPAADSPSTPDSELVWRLVRGEETMSVQARPGPDATEYVFQLEACDGTLLEALDSKSFTDEAEGQAYLQAELTRLVGEGWRRDRPELAAD